MPEKKRPRWLRYLGYVAFFLIAFVFSLYLTFPMSALKPRVLGMLEQAVQQAGPRPGRYGTPAEVKVDKISLYRFSGIELSRLSVRLASNEPDPKPTWDFDRARVRLQLLPLLLGRRWVSFDFDAYGGNVSGEALLIEQRLAELEVAADGVQVGEIPHFAAALGAPMQAELGLDAALKLGKTPKEAVGEIAIRGENAQVGPGTLKLPVPPLSLNCNLAGVIDLGKLDIAIKVAEGKAETDRAQLVGKDVDIRADMALNLRKGISTSKVSGALELKFAEELLSREKEVKSAIELAELRIKRGKDKDGTYHFKLGGSLSRLVPTPDPKAKVK